MTAPVLLRADDQGVATLTLNRPAARNALSLELIDALIAAFDAIMHDDAVRVVVLAAAGPVFCAGHDLRELRSLPDQTALENLFQRCSALMLAIEASPKPVIAKIQGMATAAGCQLVATCDLAIAVESAQFATPGVQIGLFCSTPMVALSRAVGRKAAMKMLLTGDAIDSAEAVRIGLINHAVPADQLDAAVTRLAQSIAQKSPLTLAIGKQAFHQQLPLTSAAAYHYCSNVMVRNLQTRDAVEGIDAFLSKRTPHWLGC